MRRHEPNKPFIRDTAHGFSTSQAADNYTEEEVRAKLSEFLLNAAQRGDAMSMEGLIHAGASVNHQDAQTGATALHYAAAYGARAALRVLLSSGKCDFLIRDKAGRLASEMAGLYADDPVVARLLRRKERAQADRLGISLARRPETPG